MDNCNIFYDSSSAGAEGLEGAAAESSEASLANADAERTLVRVKQKLEGREGGAWFPVLALIHPFEAVDIEDECTFSKTFTQV